MYLLPSGQPQPTTASQETQPTTQHSAGHTVGLQQVLTSYEGSTADPPPPQSFSRAQLLPQLTHQIPSLQAQQSEEGIHSYLVSKQ